jgi:hypothetical protein
MLALTGSFKMDAFLSDVLDLPPGMPPPAELFVDGQFRIDRLLASPLLHVTLAFHDAWHAAVGSPPSRVDFWDFRTRVGASALNDCLLECTPLRAMPRAQELLNRANETYQKTMSSVSAMPIDGVTSKLLRKLADRLCCGVDPATAATAVQRDEPHVVAAYTALCSRYSGLLEFEEWARVTRGGEGVSAGAPLTVTEFYERSAEVVRALDLLGVSPFSGVTLAALPIRAPFMACTEAMRLSIIRDGYLWRRDAGGAVVCLQPAGAAWPEADLKCFRTVRIPWATVMATLPSAMYARVIAVMDEELWRHTSVQRPANLASDIVNIVSPFHPDHGGLESTVVGRTLLVAVSFPAKAVLAFPQRSWIPMPVSFSSAAWAEPLHVSMLKSNVLLSEGEGTLLFQQFVARYAEARRLGSRVFDVIEPASACGEVLLIDSRPNVWSVMSILITLDNLQDGKWAARVLTSTNARAFMERCLRPSVPGIHIDVLDELPDGNEASKFDLERYNEVLKDPAFWDRIVSPHALIVQDDGMLVRRGIEERFMDYAYVGAPWADIPANAALKTEVPTLVGNGGFSLRNVAEMRRIATACAKEGRRLFNARLQPVPEDVFFASAVTKSCPTDVAEGFAMEMRVPSATVSPIGFHKPWAYLPRDIVAAFFADVIRDAEARTPP